MFILIGYPYSFMRDRLNRRFCWHSVAPMECIMFEEARRHHDQFPCPLCHAAHDNFIPRFLIDSKPFVGAESLGWEMQWYLTKSFSWKLGNLRRKLLLKRCCPMSIWMKGELKKSIDDVIVYENDVTWFVPEVTVGDEP